MIEALIKITYGTADFLKLGVSIIYFLTTTQYSCINIFYENLSNCKKYKIN